MVVVDSPLLDPFDRLGHWAVPVGVRTLIAKPAVEALDEGILHRAARRDEVDVNALRKGLSVKVARGRLGAVV